MDRATERGRWDLLQGTGVVTVRQIGNGSDAAAAVQEVGLTWPAAPLGITGDDRCCLAWRAPGEAIAVARDRTMLRALLAGLEPGRGDLAFALDLSEAIAVVELSGACLDDWLARLVDASAIPRQPGRASRARFADIGVQLLRFAPDRAWLLVERPLLPYVEDWLGYGRGGY